MIISYLINFVNMHIEYEATFANIKKEEMRKRLKQIGAIFFKPEFSTCRILK